MKHLFLVDSIIFTACQSSFYSVPNFVICRPHDCELVTI